jgi:hypothetical protein
LFFHQQLYKCLYGYRERGQSTVVDSFGRVFTNTILSMVPTNVNQHHISRLKVALGIIQNFKDLNGNLMFPSKFRVNKESC